MNRFFLSLLIIGNSLLLFGQGAGIHFEETSGWQEVLQKATRENKYIFVDCYATWCLPCKTMDTKIYTDTSVGTYFNSRFISIKVQIDSTKRDNERIIGWYADAHKMRVDYRISILPSYLFFSPEGEPLHIDCGLKSVDGFLDLAKEATNAKRQFYTLMKEYNSGIKDYSTYPFLIKMADRIREGTIANTLIKEYAENYLSNMTHDGLCTKENIAILGRYIQGPSLGSSSPFFKLFLQHPKEIDAIMNKGYSDGIIDNIVKREEIEPGLTKIKNIASSDSLSIWKKMEERINSKFGKYYAKKEVAKAKIKWYSSRNDWNNTIKAIVEVVGQCGVNGSGINRSDFNNLMWDVFFMHCEDKRLLKKAIKWQKTIMINNDLSDFIFIDTYANLLYKVGKAQQAIEWEKRGRELENSWAVNYRRILLNVCQDAIEKMERNERTWVQ